MVLGIGHYNNYSDPVLKISIGRDPDHFKQFEALIDTGCTGFLSIPATVAAELELKPDHVEQLTYADGWTGPCYGALGYASVAGKTYEGNITIEEESIHILLGIDFLRKFKLGLLMTSKLIILMDETELHDMQQMKSVDQQVGLLSSPTP